MKTVVFVCTGNTCRSPMAEGMFRVLLQQHGVTDVEVTSCGTGSFPGMPPSEYAVTVAAEYGADIAAHRSRPISHYLLEQGDLFVCMTAQQHEYLRHFLPSYSLRILSPTDISDPYGGDLEQYRTCALQIWEALQTLIKEF